VIGRQGGFTYLNLLFWVALSGAALGAVAEVWSTAQRRDNEIELLHVGEQFQAALERYGASGHFPRRLEDLLGDDKAVPQKRYLRRIYVDPIARRTEWGVVTLPDGQIIGVHSLSDREPLKHKGFPEKYAAFSDKKRYSEWVFMATNAPGVAVPNAPAPSSIGPGIGNSPDSFPPVAAPRQLGR
jgi:type II secretory pathway pseudopilin PulG